MVRSADYKGYQKLLKQGSILKALRARKGGGLGLIAAGIMFLVFAILIALPWFASQMSGWLWLAAIFGLPGLIMLLAGILLKNKRNSSYLTYYAKETGFGEGELQQIDRELTSSNVRLITCKLPNAVTENAIACFITEHYFVMDGMEPYVRRLEDIIAAAYSDSTDIWYMICLSKQDKEARVLPLQTATGNKQTLCREIIEELHKQNPAILRGQEIACEGRNYILERDSAEILRLYQEGRRLEEKI